MGFFSSVAADLALRLGPDSERSGKKCTKSMKPFCFTNKANHGENPHKNANLPARFAFRRQRKQRHKTGPEPHRTKNTTNPWGLPPTRWGKTHRVSENMHKRIKSLWRVVAGIQGRFFSVQRLHGFRQVVTCRNPRTRLALSSVPGSTFSCSEQCRPVSGRHCGP